MKRMPLVLLHSGAGSAHDFAGLTAALPHTVEPVAPELPGRGRYLDAAPTPSAEDALEWLYRQVQHLTGDFALFGQGMGAHLGVGLISLIENRTEARCVSLFVLDADALYTARPVAQAHGIPQTSKMDIPRAAAPTAPLLPRQATFAPLLDGQTSPAGAPAPAPAAQHPHGFDLLRHDRAVHDSYLRAHRHTVIESNITAFHEPAPAPWSERLEGWRASTTEALEITRLPRSRHKPHDMGPELAAEISRRLPAQARLNGRAPLPTAV